MNVENVLQAAREYYQSFEHAQWTVTKGLEVIEQYYPTMGNDLKEVYVYAMAWRNAGSVVVSSSKKGSKETMKAIDLFLKVQVPKNTFIIFHSSLLIKATRESTPIPKLQNQYAEEVVDGKFWNLVKVARDMNQIATIELMTENQRFNALVAYIKDNQGFMSDEEITAHQSDIFNDLQLHTQYGKQWEKKNLKNIRQLYQKLLPLAFKKARE